MATTGNAAWLATQGVAAAPVGKVYVGRPNIMVWLKKGEVTLLMNSTEGRQVISDVRDIQHLVMNETPYFTAASVAAVAA